MNMGLDKSRREQPSAEIEGLAFGREARLNGFYAPAFNADVDVAAVGADQNRVAEDEVHQRSM